ncbi:MAG: EAL domain-containing protein [Mariprofundaceae bacterium]|nr:EAL domain-containing protein [Mariprofundaceae bacterium]
MTLSRQLFTVITMIILIMLGRMFWISMENTRSYLSGQMQTQTSNAVDSLGIALRPHLAKKDIAMMDTLVNAVFDHGYYRSLLLTDMQGQVLIKRVNSDPVRDAPEWFIHLLPLDAPKITAVVTSGWMQYGKLTLEAHPGRAYANLWDSFRQLLMLAWWTFVIGIIAVLLLVRGMLKPLRAIEAQAIAICKREFPINDIRPWTREFRHVVEAMNRMTGKVRDMINTLTERAENLQRQARVDKLTGLANRNGFMSALAALLERHERSSSGLFLLIKLDDFAAYNDLVGYQLGDQLLKNVAVVLKNACAMHPQALSGRIGGVDFALLLPELDESTTSDMCLKIKSQLDALGDTDKAACRILLGATLFSGSDKPGDILTRADTSISATRTDSVLHLQRVGDIAKSNIDWQQVIADVLTQKRIKLLSQPVRSIDATPRTIYHEVLARIHDADGEPISPATFMPMAERLNRMVELDAMIMQMALEWLSAHPDEHLAVNLSSASLQHIAANGLTEMMVKQIKNIGPRLLVEVSEHAALQNDEITTAFIGQVHKTGVRVVMERFGSSLSSFHTLRQMHIDFLKLDGSYVRDIATLKENRFFLQTLLDIAHGLDIQVIAEQVENASDLECLQDMGIDAVQGYHIDKPKPLGD